MWLSVVAAVSHGRVHRRLGLGPRSRLDLLHDLVAALVRHERIEASWARAYEMRGYAEQFIDCVKRGDTNERDMCMVDFWLTVSILPAPSSPPPAAPVLELSVLPRRRRTSSTSCSRCWHPSSSPTLAATPTCCRSPTGMALTTPRWLSLSSRGTPSCRSSAHAATLRRYCSTSS
ncbi:large ribosomal subunit protein bL17m isoform X1 [Ciconia boyciana]|uniref:large ribosomal subunit protein bL17m isoform X1 n=1 Tax=Ciconia boyciana TaxID=52775 RepID=UPI003B9F4B4A